MRSIFSHTSVRATFMFCDQSNSSPMVPPLSLMFENMFFKPLTEPTASSTGRTTRRSTWAGEALGYGSWTNSIGLSNVGHESQRETEQRDQSQYDQAHQNHEHGHVTLDGNFRESHVTPAYSFTTAGATGASTVTREGTHT